MLPINGSSSSKVRKPRGTARKPASTPATDSTSTIQKKPPSDLFALTIDAANGRVVTLERVDATGVHHALSAEEKDRLAHAQGRAPLEELVEHVFEAGIECVLGADEEKRPAESTAERELSHMLLQSLIERSSAKHLIEGDNLDRAIIGTLIAHAATGQPAAR
jgi:hypothetical protein